MTPMTAVVPRRSGQRRSRTRRSGRVPACGLLGVLGLLAVSGPFWTVDAQGPPSPVPLPGRSVVQFVNESTVTLLLGAIGPTGFGCQPPAQPGTPACPREQVAGSVLPREGTWVLGPGAWLTVDIPVEWEKTQPKSQGNPQAGRLGPGPRFWARTGRRYDETHNIAQCETGDWTHDGTARQQGGRGVQDHEVHPALRRGPEVLVSRSSKAGAGRWSKRIVAAAAGRARGT